jgi:hypothetical protein
LHTLVVPEKLAVEINVDGLPPVSIWLAIYEFTCFRISITGEQHRAERHLVIGNKKP